MGEPTSLRDAMTRALGDMPNQRCGCGAEYFGIPGGCWDCEQASIRVAEAGPLIRQFVPAMYRGLGFDDYGCPPGDARARDAVAAWEPGSRGLYLWSRTTGTGKSHLGFALLQREARKRRIGAIEWAEFLEARKQSFDGDTRDETTVKLRSLKHAEIFLLDDLGTGQVTQWAVNELWLAVDGRSKAGLPLIVTSNLHLKELAARLTKAGDPIAADRIASRLHDMCASVEVRANDYRLNRRTA